MATGGEGAGFAEAVRRFRAARHPAALTGAGVSVESGIPDFRSPGGLWTTFPPERYATIEAFRADPERAWRLYRALDDTLRGARPNPAHEALARLEAAGRLEVVVTQNIDGLHQAAGSVQVIEMHGDHRRLQCVDCGRLEEVHVIASEAWQSDGHGALASEAGRTGCAPGVPRCRSCGSPLKPNVVLFGEAVRGLDEIALELGRCDLLLVAGTSALVHPAAGLPQLVRAHGGAIFEFNLEETALTARLTDVFFRGPAGRTLPRFADAVLA